jgi:GT2 family glycosyltransferase
VTVPLHSLGASIVLYKTRIQQIEPLLQDLQRGGVAQTYVIDNSPPGFDDSPAPTALNVELHRTGRNIGFGRAHNIAIQRSTQRFRYHLLCNPDITVLDGTVGKLIAFMEANPQVGVCMPKLLNPDGSMQHCCRRSPLMQDYLSQLLLPNTWGSARRNSLEMRSHDYNAPMDVQCLSGCFMLFRSDILKALGGFDENFFLYFEDFDLSARAQRLARNKYVPEAVVVHERQSAHRRSLRLKAAFAASALRYFRKWGWFAPRNEPRMGLERP